MIMEPPNYDDDPVLHIDTAGSRNDSFVTIQPPTLDVDNDPGAPPGYAELDPNPTKFLIDGPLIYAGEHHHEVRFQLSQDAYARFRKGPLLIKRLLPRESRRLSTKLEQHSLESLPCVNEDAALYRTECYGYRMTLKGQKRNTVTGSIALDCGWWRWHVKQVDSRGKERILFTLKDHTRQKGNRKWQDGTGKIIAIEDIDEEQKRTLELTEQLDPITRDLLVTVWATLVWWISGGFF